MGSHDLDPITEHLAVARDALIAYWEQPEGQACFLAIRFAADALDAYRALDRQIPQVRNPEERRRIVALAEEIMRLRAPLEGMI